MKRKRGSNVKPNAPRKVASEPVSEGYPRETMFGICAVLSVLVLAVFSQTLRHEFVNFDDDKYVSENPLVAGGLSWNGIAWAFTHVHASNWHPVTWLSHMLDCELYGPNPGGHHLTSVLLHAATAILLFFALIQMTSATGRSPGESLPVRRSSKSEGVWCCAFVAALFAIHPLRVESVAWVAERKDVLSGLFFMLALLAYGRYARVRVPGSRFPVSSYLAVILFFALGLMSKPMLVTLPFVLLLLDYWPLKRPKKILIPNSYFLILEKIPLFAMSAISCVVTVFAQTEAIVTVEKLSLTARLGNVLVAYATYLRQTLWPAGLAVLYPIPAGGMPISAVILSFLLLSAVSVFLFVLRRRFPYALTGWLWYLGMLVPVIGFMQVGLQAHADRYTYLPQIGLFIILTWGAADLSRRWRHRSQVCGVGATLVLATLTVCAWIQTSHWRDSQGLWTHTLGCTSGNAVAQNNLGYALAAQGKSAEAVEHYERALEIKPDYAHAHNNLGHALATQGKLAEAVEHYLLALGINPEYAEAHNNLAYVLNLEGKPAEAAEHCLRALEIKPDYGHAHNNLGNALAAQGKLAEAVGHYRRVLEIMPGNADTHTNLAYVLNLEGKPAEAAEHCLRALEIKADFTEAHNNLGNALAAQGKPAEAVEQYLRALEIRPGSAETLYNLGVTLAAEGRFADVIKYYSKALESAPESVAVLNRLSWILATCPEAPLRNGSRAIELARKAERLVGSGNPAVLDTLAAAYAEAGQFPEAVETVGRALDLAVKGNDKALAEEIRTRLRLYEAGMPYLEEARKR